MLELIVAVAIVLFAWLVFQDLMAVLIALLVVAIAYYIFRSASANRL